MNVFFALFTALCFVLAGCGGGGSKSVVPLTIGAPDLSQTEQSEIFLSGRSFVPADSFCYTNQTIRFRAFAGPYSITWKNLTNNQSGSANIWPFCEDEVNWSVLPAIALVSGDNQITVTLTTDEGTWQDSIIVTRTPDITPPTVFSWYPGGGSIYNGMISFTFSEPVDPGSLWTNFALRDIATNTLVAGVGTINSLTANFQPDTALEPNTTYVVHIEGVADLAGNLMSEPFEWEFVTDL